MLTELITRACRRYLVGKEQEFKFRAVQDIELTPLEKIDLYVHIPFCKNMCPFCPYNRIKFDKNLVKSYLKALLWEIEKYHSRLGTIEVSSIYIGGGTPTNLLDELGIIIEKLDEKFIITGNICVETNPEDINKKVTNKLTRYGVDLISLGVQSFDNRYLKLLGRKYEADILAPAIDLVLSSNFKTVNLDLMFALPGQTLWDVKRDLDRGIQSGADQITVYPLFCFPYSTVGKYKKLKKVKMPNIITRRRMYKLIHDHFSHQGFQRVSVWGFKRGSAPRYSSVTRDSYIGLGAGAGSHVAGGFYLNTFSVYDYIKACSSGCLPVALKMDFTQTMSIFYWLYWRFYDTYIPRGQMFELFNMDNKTIRKVKHLLSLIKILGMAEEKEGQIVLNERGAFWLHLMQNYFSLNYINKVWSAARETPYPPEVSI